MRLTKGAVFVFILVLIAVVAVTIAAEIAKFETNTRYDVTAISRHLEVIIHQAARKTVEQRTALQRWIVVTHRDLVLVSHEMERLCRLAERTINPPTPTP